MKVNPLSPKHGIEAPAKILSHYFQRKKTKNPNYSLRALARDVGKSPAFVSQILSGKRRPPAQLTGILSDVLELDKMARKKLSWSFVLNSDLPPEIKADLESSTTDSAAREEHAKYLESTFPEFNLLRRWYYPAILDLISLADFQPKSSWIAKKLKLSEPQIQSALSELFSAGLIIEKDGKWKKAKFKLWYSTKSSKETVRAFHKQMIEKSLTELQKTDQPSFEQRLISGLTIACNPKNLEKAKTKLNNVLFEISKLLSEGECTTLYQLNFQLFNLTASQTETERAPKKC